MKFVQRAKRRRAGIYVVRTDKHLRPGREIGYVGRSNHVPKRRNCHLGLCPHTTCQPKDWTDLAPTWWSMRLPWWASWKWVQAPIEVVMIRVLLPRYNVQHNRGNPRRVPLAAQKLQRAARDRQRVMGYRGQRAAAHLATWTLRAGGALCVLVGLTMALVTR